MMPTSKSPPKYSDELIEKYRLVHVEYGDWYDCVYQDFKERMRAIGVNADKMYFSGFWSQGDGACFEGDIRDWGKYLTHLGYTDPILINCADNNWSYRWTHSGRYYHHKSIDYQDDLYLPDNPYTEHPWTSDFISDEDEFRGTVWAATMGQYDLLALTEKIQEDLEDHMQDLYRQLEAEYDYLTSDEVVVEWLEANDIDPDELTDQE